MATLSGLKMAPAGAGTLRGPRYARLLVDPKARQAQRNVAHVSANVFDVLPPGSNRNGNEACDLAMNVYAQTRLRYSLVADNLRPIAGEGFSVQVRADVLQGNVNTGRAFARMVSPSIDIGELERSLNPNKIKLDDVGHDQRIPKFDFARALAEAERRDRKSFKNMDQQMKVAVHENGPMHVHVKEAPVAGSYNLSVYIEGDYCPDHDVAASLVTLATHTAAAGEQAHRSAAQIVCASHLQGS